ncbi:MAG: geranylgeranylglycerol-phosphate geranylgeranyltransferase [Candidatus ainarchaeum sp.]|nr:geranylgeranylglycerol-phosphate geranylgeranyltransferase [Candidatus ainarchaeum sp.]
MIKEKIKLFSELIRLKNCLMAGIGAIIGYFIALNYFILDFNLILIFLSVFFVCAGGQAINDYFDSEIDAKVSKNKPIPSKRITKKEVLELSIFLFLAGISVSFFINFILFLTAIAFSILLIVYAAVLYKVKYVGNLVVALSTAFTFIFGAMATNNLPQLVILFAISAFFANTSREIIKDIEDLKKDKGFKKTLPMISLKASNILPLIYYAASIIIGFSAFIFFNLNLMYLILFIIATVIILLSSKFLVEKNYNKSQKFAKLAMFVMLLAYIVSIIRF